MNSQRSFDGFSLPPILYNTPSITSISTILTYGVLSVALFYFILGYLDSSIPSVLELLWVILVYLTPASLIAVLDRNSDAARNTEKSRPMYLTFSSRSEAMRRILGLDSGGILTNIQRDRSLSGLGTVFKSVEKNSLPGLGNWDNSCYQNSILQGLASLSSVLTFLDAAARASLTAAEGDGRSTSRALRDVLLDLNNPANAGQRLWTPAVLKSMSSWQQQDAQEYYSKILEQVDKESSRASKERTQMVGLLQLKTLSVKPYEDSFATLTLTESARSHANPPDLEQSETSLPTALKNPLEGLLAQRVGCLQCGYVEGLSLIPFNCLTVPLGKQWMYDIRTCLDDYTALEQITGVECSKCTLLRHRDQLERLLERSSVSSESNSQPQSRLSETLRKSATERLRTVTDAIEIDDLSEATIVKKCQIPARNRVSSTKSKQAVIARPPTSLVMHINRSVFDEATGLQSKNYADVRFPRELDLSPWVLGGLSPVTKQGKETEIWNNNPSESMLPEFDDPEQIETLSKVSKTVYTLQAVVTHYGRHENGHYVCYRKGHSESNGNPGQTWWRLSDDDVSRVSEDEVLAQGGVFMLFYELLRDNLLQESVVSKVGKNLDAVISCSDKPGDLSHICTAASEPEQLVLDTIPQKDVRTVQDHQHEPFPPPSSPPSLRPLSVPPPSDTATTGNNPTKAESQTRTKPEVQTPPAPTEPESSVPKIEMSIGDTLYARQAPTVAPPMRTAGPRGSGGRGSVKRAGKAMNSVSSMVTAN